ncbi:TetR/AcrR family transcriptional regulator C-terminal domain-containing protein [Actinoallomurus spadix]|uniref:TetR/AcrR family transcriptional regulator n=1 Tax=Actinoallomurus spadix TaxID=79912 RepID=A0ABP3GFJ8_9ACTN|nr:TetR/AcrR family transcriptional regulator C-terminal domain-containing protein [Actinoallomurus spadix]MCO5990977.1 TetR/AcrR family transcriptional regulator C-terminal domain-containing protein [Actinoallomurus spadix]
MRLTRDQVVTGGLDLLDEVGLDKLTMRRLAAALGVQNGATYWHFPSKQALLEAMADRMLDGVAAAPEPGVPWDERITETAHRLRRALLARRDGARVFAGVFFPLPNALAYGESMNATLREAGLTSRDAVWAVDALTYYVVGHVAEEQLAAALPDGGRPAAARLNAALDPQQYPTLHAAAGDVAVPHPREHFSYGLDLLLTGIRARVGGSTP